MNKTIPTTDQNFTTFVKEIKSKILSSQHEALKVVNKELINLYWDIGKKNVEKQEAFGWDKSVVKNLSIELQKEFVGMKGFSERNLWNMQTFYIEYKDNSKLQALTAQIGWTYRALDNHIDNKSYESPSIGIIICKEKKRTTAEYALKESNQPIGIATYKLTESLPNDLKGLLPTAQEISQRLENLLGKEND